MSKARWMVALLLLVIVVGFAGCGGFVLSQLLFSGPAPYTQLNTATLVTQVQGLAQLVTVKYVMEKVVVLEDVKLWGENRVLLVAHGVVKAGVDLSKLKPKDVEIHGKKIIIQIPAAEITDCYLDEDQTQVIENTTGLLRRFNKDLEQNARREGLDAIRRAARYTGILKDANQRASLQLTTFLNALGFAEVEVKKGN
jgi:hypothetical protein